jgi:AcrR family transcriptional regulator
LNSAQQVFSNYGYISSSNKMIGKAADVTPGTLYYYFESKQALFAEVHFAVQRAMLEEMLPALESSTFRECVDRLLAGIERSYANNPNHARFMAIARMEASRDKEIKEALLEDPWRDLYSGLVDIGIASGEIKVGDARTVRSVLAAVVLGVMTHGFEAHPKSHQDLIRGVVALFSGDLLQLPRA